MYKRLKWIRVVIAIIFLLFITLSFTFLAKYTGPFYKVLHFQIVPALLSFTALGLTISLFIIILTLIFGRVYCSLLCPLGIFQDVISRVASIFKSKKARRLPYRKPHNILRYSIALIVFISLIFGLTTPLLFLDPYSSFGRVVSQLFNPAFVGINNILGDWFPSSVSHRTLVSPSLWLLILTIIFFLIVVVMSALRGRLYCNTICPVGTLLGGLSRISLFKLAINSDACVSCNLCTANCKSQCIDCQDKTIDESRCVVCLNCTTVCSRGGVRFVYRWKKKGATNPSGSEGENLSNPESKGRREAIVALGTVATVLAVRGLTKNKGAESNIPSDPEELIKDKEPKLLGIVPPGGVGLAHLIEHCTACHACITACPNGIIKPATKEYGLKGIFLPVISFEKHFCGYDCNKCMQVCPTGALKHLSIEEKKRVQIGRVRFIAKNCIVFQDKTDCGACDEHCPTKAITMKEWKNGLYFPTVNREICIGCGGCEYVCPAEHKAMVVIPSLVHKRSEAPLEEKQEETTVSDFGF